MLKNYRLNQTPQTEKAKSEQVKNNAGGYVFEAGLMAKLDRFLMIGTESATYYTSAAKLTRDNVGNTIQLLHTDPVAAIQRTVEVSKQALAKSNDPAIFVLALAMNVVADEHKAMVKSAVNDVVRTATHLFTYAAFLKQLGGLGRAKKESLAQWYENKSVGDLAYQLVKYRQRNGWNHRDVMRLGHPNLSAEYANAVNFALGKDFNVDAAPKAIQGFTKLQAAKSIADVNTIVAEYDLPWEAAPTNWHNDASFWRNLFDTGNMPLGALVRNLTRFAKLNMFNDMRFTKEVADKLKNEEEIRNSRLHPFNFLNALVVFTEGQVERNGFGGRTKTWNSNAKIAAALEEAFYRAFRYVEPANKRTMIGLDVSSSMSWTAGIGTDLTAAQVGAVMAMTLLRTEPYAAVHGFAGSFVDLGLSESDSLATVNKKVASKNFGSTDCAVPMLYAAKYNIEVDTFIVITDNETWVGNIHPFQALQRYRKQTGIPARLAVVGVTANNFSIADKNDFGMMDFCGFGADAPAVLAKFSAGSI